VPPPAPAYGRSNIPKAPSVKTVAVNRERKLPIRERLRQWTAEQDQQHARAMPPDVFIYGTIANSLNRTQTTGSGLLMQVRLTAWAANQAEKTLSSP